MLLLTWANGANDVSKGIATLIGSGLAKPAPAILWGAFWTLAGGIAAAFWGSILAANFAHGYLATDFRPDTAFIAGALSGAFGWVGIATRLGLPVSTPHVSTGSLMGVRFTDRSQPRQADAFRTILLAWLVTLPAAALIGAGVTWVLGGLL